jgi:DnaJ-class molecular chaperone
MALETAKCPDCDGSGECDDADLGDIYFNTWKCPKCNGTGVTKKIAVKELI